MSVSYLMEIGLIERISIVDWIIIPVFAMIIILAFVRSRENDVFQLLFKSYFSISTLKGVYVGKQKSSNSELLLNVNGFLALGIFAYIYQVHVLNSENSMMLLLISIGAFLLWYFIKHLIISFVRFVSEEKNILVEINASRISFYQVLGVLFIPGLLIALLIPENSLPLLSDTSGVVSNLGFWYCVVIAAILYIFRVFQGFLQSVGLKISRYYIILYLCTLEILPLIVLFRVLSGNITSFN